MNNINDNELDVLIREAEASNEKPSPEINREILRRIENMGDKEGNRYGILKYGLVFVSGFLCAAH